MELFPAVMIGGPPHSGKSVLAYSLTQALRARDISHYVLRAYPDSEGDWANEANQALVRQIRLKGQGTLEWIEHICRDIRQRHLPLLVDVGGQPTEWQEAVFDYCTHAILLTPNEPARSKWRRLVTMHQVPIIANLHSTLTELDEIFTQRPVLTARISGLERGETAAGPVFEALVDLLANLFAYEETELRQVHLTVAPTDLTVELSRIGHTLGLGENRWTWSPADLPKLLDYIPEGTPLAVYDRGPNWLYAALASHAYPAKFYQFDVRLGWVAPPNLKTTLTPATSAIEIQSYDRPDHTRLEITLLESYLDYDEAGSLEIPTLPSDKGLVLSGKLPLWLWTALVCTYHQVPWLGIYQPQLNKKEPYAVVIATHRPDWFLGQLVASPPPNDH